MLFPILQYYHVAHETIIFYDLLIVSGFNIDASPILLGNTKGESLSREVVGVLLFGVDVVYDATCRVFFSCFTVMFLIDKLAGRQEVALQNMMAMVATVI